MAKDLEEAQFWLPSEFLCDDFFLEEKKSREAERGLSGSCLLGEFPHGFGSDGDEDDHVAGLARKLAHSFLADDEKDSSSAFPSDSAKFMVGSPQSTLCGLSNNSGKGSPDGPSKVSSPTSIEKHQENTLFLLYQAAGQVMKQRLENRGFQQNLYGRGLVGSSRGNSAAISAPPPNPPGTGYYSPPVLSQQQLKAAQLYQLKQQQLSAGWGRPNRARGGGGGYGVGFSPSTCPLPKQQQQQFPPQPGPGMRTGFRTGSGARREKPTGTGVFLPRRVGAQPESRKKPACSTVLLPAKVVQALNLNLEELSPHPRIRGSFLLDQDALLGRSSAVSSHQKRKNDHLYQPSTVSSHEIRLPQEWTY